MKTWKKIEETKKRAGEITDIKKRKEEKLQKVCTICLLTSVENSGPPVQHRDAEVALAD